jgi:hypothetical protein
MPLSQLIYYSREENVGRGGILDILDRARSANERDAVTGVLVFDRRWFLQCLEGTREQLTAKFLAISADPRHSGVTLLLFDDIDERVFDDWTMAAVEFNGPPSRGPFDPSTLTTAQALQLLRQIRATAMPDSR